METALTNSGAEIEIGGNYLVRQGNDTVRLATILEMRLNENAGQSAFYVHYDATDHRLDEWVSADCIEVSQTARPSTSSEEVPSEQIKQQTMKLTRMQRRKHDELVNVNPSNVSSNVSWEKTSQVKRIERIMYGDYLIDTWYHSPYPKEYEDSNILYVCDYCLKYMMYDYTYVKHRQDCRRLHPPGKEIYRDGTFALYEVHGSYGRAKPYCQCLCYLAKLFIDQKTIFCDLESFMFYVLCETKGQRSSMVGYFSKEIGSIDDYNLACICILPPFQRTGYGKLLIQFSYELSKREGIVGSPEKPLSDLGKYSYRSYWSWALLETLKTTSKITLEDLSKVTGIHQDDIVDCFENLRLTKFWKGTPLLRLRKTAIEKCYRSGTVKKPRLILKPELLIWKPPSHK